MLRQVARLRVRRITRPRSVVAEVRVSGRVEQGLRIVDREAGRRKIEGREDKRNDRDRRVKVDRGRQQAAIDRDRLAETTGRDRLVGIVRGRMPATTVTEVDRQAGTVPDKRAVIRERKPVTTALDNQAATGRDRLPVTEAGIMAAPTGVSRREAETFP
jgi:hypothetical protein